ncbi:MAG: 3-hydroxyacyl-CoA dehydrogenase [Acidimicrobiia bacterium]|nr:3-hydroxyacyl-CoA dehydrogenase [Acidimicrobiia bacterium]
MEKIGIVGAGTMGGGIGQVAAAHGHLVTLYDSQPGAAEAMIQGIIQRLERWTISGRVDEGDAKAIIDRLSFAASLEGLAASELVIEAVSEDLPLKQKVFAALEEIVGTETIIASNTSSLSITEIAAGLRSPERVVGMHFFNPAPIMKLVEIVSGDLTNPDVAKRCFDLVRGWDKHPVMCHSHPGFVGNFVNRPFYLEAVRIREEGIADERTIDELMVRAAGFRMGPFELMDLVGVDVNLAVSEAVWNALGRDPRFEPSGVQRTMVKLGKLGRKSGHGFYPYGDLNVSPRPRIVPPGASTTSIRIGPTSGGLHELVDRARANDIVVNTGAEIDGIEVDDVRLTLSDGFTAREHTMGSAIPAVLVDWAHDLSTTSSLGIASDVPRALPSAAGFLHQIGIEALHLNDSSGLVVGRIMSSLINLAAEAHAKNVASREDIDTAMLLGFNYPEGPLSWGRRLGPGVVHAILRHMGDHLDKGRYGPTEELEAALATST